MSFINHGWYCIVSPYCRTIWCLEINNMKLLVANVWYLDSNQKEAHNASDTVFFLPCKIKKWSGNINLRNCFFQLLFLTTKEQKV